MIYGLDSGHQNECYLNPFIISTSVLYTKWYLLLIFHQWWIFRRARNHKFKVHKCQALLIQVCTGVPQRLPTNEKDHLRFPILVFQVECDHKPYPKLRPLLWFCKSRRSLSLTIIVWISAWGMFLATQSLFVSLHQKPFIVLTRGSWALLCSDSGSATRSSCDWQKYTELQAQHSKIKSLDPPH